MKSGGHLRTLEHKPMSGMSQLVCGGISISATAVAVLLVERNKDDPSQKSELVVWDQKTKKVIHVSLYFIALRL